MENAVSFLRIPVCFYINTNLCCEFHKNLLPLLTDISFPVGYSRVCTKQLTKTIEVRTIELFAPKIKEDIVEDIFSADL